MRQTDADPLVLSQLRLLVAQDLRALARAAEARNQPETAADSRAQLS